MSNRTFWGMAVRLNQCNNASKGQGIVKEVPSAPVEFDFPVRVAIKWTEDAASKALEPKVTEAVTPKAQPKWPTGNNDDDPNPSIGAWFCVDEVGQALYSLSHAEGPVVIETQKQGDGDAWETISTYRVNPFKYADGASDRPNTPVVGTPGCTTYITLDMKFYKNKEDKDGVPSDPPTF
eukprot:NODE_444_length_833_cov_358.628895_g435_i0.p1 GENE.NODE_444_length_833_cov_358.628895_g435_i0~~NODE_444_length_833_cov_358.628895_g435_i0.p1  ORF type:complete len:179 (+),score=26.42 NODE_444_length_833_cov_358.628895_g435_i0:81-617(+)